MNGNPTFRIFLFIIFIISASFSAQNTNPITLIEETPISEKMLLGKWQNTKIHYISVGTQKEIKENCSPKNQWIFLKKNTTFTLNKITFSGAKCQRKSQSQAMTYIVNQRNIDYLENDVAMSENIIFISKSKFCLSKKDLINNQIVEVIYTFKKIK